MERKTGLRGWQRTNIRETMHRKGGDWKAMDRRSLTFVLPLFLHSGLSFVSTCQSVYLTPLAPSWPFFPSFLLSPPLCPTPLPSLLSLPPSFFFPALLSFYKYLLNIYYLHTGHCIRHCRVREGNFIPLGNANK